MLARKVVLARFAASAATLASSRASSVRLRSSMSRSSSALSRSTWRRATSSCTRMARTTKKPTSASAHEASSAVSSARRPAGSGPKCSMPPNSSAPATRSAGAKTPGRTRRTKAVPNTEMEKTLMLGCTSCAWVDRAAAPKRKITPRTSPRTRHTASGQRRQATSPVRIPSAATVALRPTSQTIHATGS